jgi:hydroxyacylglutathione hydrolase
MAVPLRVRSSVFDSNSYLCPTSVPGECLLVDPGLDGKAIDDALEASGLRPVAVACTHGHFDHVGRAEEYQRRLGIPVYLHRDDTRTASGSNFLMMAFKVPARITLPRFSLVEGGAPVRVGADELRWIHTPGHTPGSCVVLFQGVAFTGDTLYRDGIGLVSLPGEDEALLRRSIEGLWSDLPAATLVCPGHGGSAPFGEIQVGNRPLRRFLGMEVPA